MEVMPDTGTVEDYKYLEGQVFRDDDSEVLYVTTRVAVQRKYVVAFVALVLVKLEEEKLNGNPY